MSMGSGTKVAKPLTHHQEVDEATVALLRATTPRAYLARNDADERMGVDPYDDGLILRTVRDPRDELAACPECDADFWTRRRARFCSRACEKRAESRRRRVA